MENQHRQIKGYRELSQAEIDLMNEIKAFGPQLQELCAKVDAHVRQQIEAADKLATEGIDPSEQDRLKAANPTHWSNWGESTFQAGLMYLTRAVAQPTFF